MAEYKLTVSQQAVVDNTGGALLVSAAAGSGKTKVLVDRVLNRICDPDAPCNIDDFLIITYTKAAAAELRVKIAQALSEKLSEQPQNLHLQRQLNRIYLAEISTVHSFCANLLRTYAHMLDLAPDFRIAEESECNAIKNAVLVKLLEQGYETRNEEFGVMASTFGFGRDDKRLTEAVFMAYDAMRCRPDMEKWAEETRKMLEISQYDGVEQTPWGKYVLEEFHQFLRQQISRMEQSLQEMQRYPAIEKAYGKVFAENIRQLQGLLACPDWDTLVGQRVESFGRLGALRKPEDPAVKDRLAGVRKKCWADLQKWQKMFYAMSAPLLEDLQTVSEGTIALIRFAEAFDKAYAAEKKRRKLMDFSDLEHTAIRLLTERYTGKPSKIAREVSKRYREIMVDEYQDSNMVQEVIFESISKDGKNRFMVGDIKQSIYRFRLADPTLFLRKYETYPDHLSNADGEPRKILLSENFRSRPEILDACNSVFGLIMRKQVGELDYGEAESLKPGKTFPETGQTAVELHCLTSSDPEGEADKRDLEADFVAGRIQQMLEEKTLVTGKDGLRPVRPGDIVILMRAVSGNAAAYLEALKKRGIPAVCNRSGDLLETTEVQLLVSLMHIIDNPHQDVPLLAVLASPLFCFSADALARPRTRNRKDDFYDIMQDDPQFSEFLRLLGELREAASWMGLQELIDEIFLRTDIASIFSAMADGVQRQKNLLAFRSAAVAYESDGSKSLTQFLSYLSDLQSSGSQLPLPQLQSEDAVTLMTIHKSKGLEFPVVFLSDLSHQFNTSDMKEAVLVDDALGVGCNRIDHTRYVRYPTLAKMSIVHKKRKEAVSEELRILYVAMTRPKDMLIMTYYSKHLARELEALNSQITAPLSDELCASVNNPGKWILLTALCRTEAGELFKLAGSNDVSQVSRIPWKIRVHDLFAESAGDGGAVEEQPESIPLPVQAAHLFREYPDRSVCNLPAKLTATQLKGRLVDEEVSQRSVNPARTARFVLRKPRFLSRDLTPAEKGTATHLFMQFADYQKCSSLPTAEEEVHRLLNHEFLTAEQADAVDLEKIVALFQSPLGQWLLKQEKITREFKFSLLTDAGELYGKGAGEQVLFQGVIDCFADEADGMTVVDFKTDLIRSSPEEKAQYYRPQIEAYSQALERIFQKPVKRKVLYFFSVDTAVEIK